MFGLSKLSDELKVFAADLPGPPMHVLKGPSNSDRVEIRWTAPKVQGLKVTSYSVYFRASNNAKRRVLATTTKTNFQHNVSKMANGTLLYEITASNAKGEGPTSKILHIAHKKLE